MYRALVARTRAVSLGIIIPAAVSAVATAVSTIAAAVTAAAISRIAVRVVARIAVPAVIAAQAEAAVAPRIVAAEITARHVDPATRNGWRTFSRNGFADRGLAVTRTAVRRNGLARFARSRVA